MSGFSLAALSPVRGEPPKGEWLQTFNDDFGGTTLDTSQWSSGYGWGNITNWSAEYCDPDNVTVSHGQCHLRVENRAEHGKLYASGAINTKGKFSQRYGYFEARIKMAVGQGLLNAFWGKRSDESWPPEIDVTEVLGKSPSRSFMTVHYAADNQQDAGHYSGPDFSDDFHIFGVEWTPVETIFYIDNIERFRTSQGASSFDGPFYWMLNIHVGAAADAWSGVPDNTTMWPATMDIDWVRAWKRKKGS